MAASPTNRVETWVSWTLKLTWAIYFIGGLYLVGPILAWGLGGLAVLALYLGPAMPAGLRATGPIPPVIWAWLAGMTAMLVTLWIGHID